MTAKDEALSSGPPTRIKRYEVISHLATGGMAEVLLAKSSGLGGFEKVFAIKRIRPAMLLNKDFASMILDEARIVATLQHSNIVQVFDVDTDDGAVFIVMEYLHGHDVREMLRRTKQNGTRMPLEHVLGIVMGVAAGLHHAHEKTGKDGTNLGLVHRDVSPHNVIVTLDGAVKLIDFGIVKAENKLSETAFGIVKGKPGYMSPEQCAGDPIDRRTDVYGIGVMLYQLSTGSLPLDADSPEEYFLGVLERDPIPPSQRVPDYPKDLEEIVMGALERDPTKRFQTTEAVRHALEEFALAERLPVSPFGLARYVEDLFKVETAQWKIAKKAGKSLVEHLTTTGKELAGSTPSTRPTALHDYESAARPKAERPEPPDEADATATIPDTPHPGTERISSVDTGQRPSRSRDEFATKMVHTPSSAGDARISRPDLAEARKSDPDVAESRLSDSSFSQARVSESEIARAPLAERLDARLEALQGTDSRQEDTWDSLSEPEEAAGVPTRQGNTRLFVLLGALLLGGAAAAVLYTQQGKPAAEEGAREPEKAAEPSVQDTPTAAPTTTAPTAPTASATAAPTAEPSATAPAGNVPPSVTTPPTGWKPPPAAPPQPRPPPPAAPPPDDLDSPLPGIR